MIPGPSDSKALGKVAEAATRGNLFPLESRHVREPVQVEVETNISLVFEIRQTDWVAVFDARPRSVDNNLAHVRLFAAK